jgi:DNA primase
MELLEVLEKVLGRAHKSTGDNYSFNCPRAKHLKSKLYFNLKTHKYQCYSCAREMSGSSLKSLFKRINKYEDYKEVIKKYQPQKATKEYKTEEINLPENFKPLWQNLESKDPDIQNALKYLKSRRIKNQDILKYNIGLDNNYNIIIPSYDEDGKLNYFTSKNYITDRYKNPKLSRNIIGFELYINWNAPIILCEGMFDAIAFKRNCIPLLGKTISKTLRKKLMNSSVNRIYICLDNDALKQAIQHCEELIKYGKELFLVELEGKDMSELGFEKSLDILEKAKPLTFQELFKKKIELA